MRDKALGWVPEVMRFAGAAPVEAEHDELQVAEQADNAVVAAESTNDDNQSPRELAA